MVHLSVHSCPFIVNLIKAKMYRKLLFLIKYSVPFIIQTFTALSRYSACWRCWHFGQIVIYLNIHDCNNKRKQWKRCGKKQSNESVLQLCFSSPMFKVYGLPNSETQNDFSFPVVNTTAEAAHVQLQYTALLWQCCVTWKACISSIYIYICIYIYIYIYIYIQYII